jgi:flagellar hook-associated protein 3 FlgL
MTMFPTNIRVTQTSLANTATSNLEQTLDKLGQIQNEISSNKRISVPSDDPVGTVSALRTRSAIGQNTQIASNISDATSWLSTADSTLNTMVSQLTQARTLAIQAQNGALDQSDLDAIATQISNIRQTALGLANTQYNGRSIFAGTANGPAYDASGNYTGTSAAVERTVAPGVRMQINVNGDTAFGAAGADVFSDLANLSAAVSSGSSSAIGTALTALDTGSQNVSTSLADVGAREQRLSALQTQNSGDALTLQQDLSSVEEPDITQAVMQLQMQQNAYQAALAVTARVIQPSLVDFLSTS